MLCLCVCICADLLESLTSNRSGIRLGSRLQWNTACGLNLLLLYACVQLCKKSPLSAVLFLVKKMKLNLFNDHQPYVAQTYHDEKNCLRLGGTAVSAGHGKFEEKDNERQQRVCVLLADLDFFHCLQLRSLFLSSGGSAQMY